MDWLTALSKRKSSLVQFSDWTRNRRVSTLGTNAGATPLPFQNWHRFKEAYTPELIGRAVQESTIPVRHLVDAFGGSGTSALSAQFLGIASTSIEVNPFLADVIRAKITYYESDALIHDLGKVVRHVKRTSASVRRFSACPATFIEPGINGRYLFHAAIAECLASIQTAIETLKVEAHRRFFRVLLGGILVAVSNVRISGKGRRYRQGWQNRKIDPVEVLDLFVQSALQAIVEVHAHMNRPRTEATVLTSDARIAINEVEPADLIVFSPPYPNSFDYTDVYNLELWMLGYLGSPQNNHALRFSTLSSHVQIKRNFAPMPDGSKSLSQSVKRLHERRDALWSPWIPEMIGGYFADMSRVLTGCAHRLNDGGQIWMVVGNSQYAGVVVAVDQILIELAPRWNLRFIVKKPFRSMRVSAQQGGKEQLAETLVILAKD